MPAFLQDSAGVSVAVASSGACCHMLHFFVPAFHAHLCISYDLHDPQRHVALALVEATNVCL